MPEHSELCSLYLLNSGRCRTYTGNVHIMQHRRAFV